MKKCCGFLVNNMALFVLLIGVVGAVRPQTLTWVGPYVGWLLGVAAQFLIMPLAAWFLVWLFALPPELAIGVVLVGTCPGGTASNVISYLAKGDVALSVSMTMATTLLAPVVTPTLTWLLAGSWIEVSFTAMMISIAQMVLLPLLLGLTAHHFFERTVEKILPVMPVVSVVTIVLLVGGVVALGAESLLDVGLLMAAIVVLHNAFGLVLGYGMARLFRLDSKKARTVSIEVGMQNSGMAASLAVLYFSPAAAIPGAIFSVWHNISGSIVANYFARRDERKRVDVKNVESIHLA